jgi:hypothetical protein
VNSLLLRWSAIIFVIGLFTVLASGCVVPAGGYGYDDGVDIGVDYYEPYGGTYGGWGAGYFVGPYRDGGHRPDRGHRPDLGGGHQSQHAYTPTPPSRSVPSIPSRSRSGRSR